MPQQPASRSTTVADGMRDSSALAGAASPIDRWWQCGWSRTWAGPGFNDSVARPCAHSDSRNSRTAPTAWRPPGLARCSSPRSSSGASSRTADRQLGSTKTIAVAAFARHRTARGRSPRPGAGLPASGPARSAAGRSSTFGATLARCRRLHHLDRGQADLRIGVLGERIGKQQRALAAGPSRSPDP